MGSRPPAAAGLGMVAAIGLGALLWVTTSMWASGVGLQGQETSLRMAVAWSGLAAATNAVAAMARSLDRLHAYAIITVTQSVAAQAAGLVLAAVQHRQPYGYFEGALACQAVALAMACVVARPTVRIVKQRSAMGPMMIFSLGMLPQGVASFVLSSADRIIVQRDLGPWAVGRYQLAYNLGAVGILLAASLNGAWIPTLLAITSRDHLAQVLEETRDRLGWLVVTSVVGMAVGFPAILILWVPRQDLSFSPRRRPDVRRGLDYILRFLHALRPRLHRRRQELVGGFCDPCGRRRQRAAQPSARSEAGHPRIGRCDDGLLRRVVGGRALRHAG